MVPQIVKDDFYKTFQSPDNYKKLIIKDNEIVDKLRDIFKNNVWNLEAKCLEMKNVNKAQNKNYYNAWLNEIYLLDYKTKPKLKPINIKAFLNLEYKSDGNTDRTEKNNVAHFRTLINQMFRDQADIDNLSWFALNQNEVLLKLMTHRNSKNNSLETLRKDLNLLLHFLKLSGAGEEIINKYKVLNMALSLIHNLKEGQNILDDKEQTNFISYKELLKLQKSLYESWEQAYEQQIIIKNKDPKVRLLNIKALLLSFYSLFPPLRLEPMTFKIVNSEEEAKEYDNAILIEKTKNPWLSKKGKNRVTVHCRT